MMLIVPKSLGLLEMFSPSASSKILLKAKAGYCRALAFNKIL